MVLGRRALPALSLLLVALAACEGGSPEPVHRVRAMRAATATECPGGGALVALGLDRDGDGALGDAEVTGQSLACAEDGSSPEGLVATALFEPAGAACPCGGARLSVGYDDGASGGIAGNGRLEGGEVRHATVDCAPAPAAAPPGLAFESEGQGGFSALFVVDVAAGAIREITSGGSFLVTLSRPVTAGDLVVYLRAPAPGALREPFVHRLSTGVDTRLHATGAGGHLLDARPGEAGTVFLRGVDLTGASGEGIWSLATATGALTRVTGDDLFFLEEWTGGAGLPVAFSGTRADGLGGEVKGIHVVGGGTLVRVEGLNQLGELSAGPPGVAFVGSLDFGLDQLHLVGWDGAAPVAVTATGDGTGYAFPAWAGSRLAYLRADPDGSHHVLLRDPAGGAPAELTPSGSTWLVSGLAAVDGLVVWVALQDGGPANLWCHDVASGVTARVTDEAAPGRNFVL